MLRSIGKQSGESMESVLKKYLICIKTCSLARFCSKLGWSLGRDQTPLQENKINFTVKVCCNSCEAVYWQSCKGCVKLD